MEVIGQILRILYFYFVEVVSLVFSATAQYTVGKCVPQASRHFFYLCILSQCISAGFAEVHHY